MKIQTYHKQNKIQRQAIEFIQIFKPNSNQVMSLRNKGIETYKPKINRIKLSVGSLVIAGCLVTPCTNLFIIPVLKWLIK